MPRDLQHPVWAVYDLLRTTRLNVKYYTHKLRNAEKQNMIVQIILASAVPSSAIAGFEIWDFGLGKHTWKYFTVFAAIVAFIQPFLGLTEKVKTLSAIIANYTNLLSEVESIKVSIETNKKYSNYDKRKFALLIKKRAKIEALEHVFDVDKKLQKQYRIEVQKQLPSKYFYVPDSE